MKIAVLNFSGNVGKTTISKYLLERQMKCDIFSVESINSSSLDSNHVTKITHEQFDELQTALLINENLIVDIGSSNVENLLKEVSTYTGSENDFDYFLIPTTPNEKQIIDTISTILNLVEDLKIPKEKIKLVYNFVENEKSIDSDFIKLNKALKAIGISESSIGTIFKTDYFSRVESIRDALSPEFIDLKDKILDIDYICENKEEMENDLNNLKSNFKLASDDLDRNDIKSQMIQLASLVQLARLSINVKNNLDENFEKLFPDFS